MPQNGWQRRVDRAEELAQKHAFATEILHFYAAIARFQGDLFRRFSREADALRKTESAGSGMVSGLVQNEFPEFLVLLRDKAPPAVVDRARELHSGPPHIRVDLLNQFWSGVHPQRQEVDEFIARAFLQPYAEFVRVQTKPAPEKHVSTVCPFCGRRPGVGVLRSLGEGGQRSLVCSFCLEEWTFRRILCPGCGEEDHQKLPVFTATELEHVRVEACDTCKTYIKTVDLTRNGLADPVVDEIATVPLDLWAQERGYAKLQPNLMQM